MTTLKPIRLYGEFGARFGRIHHAALDTDSPAEAIRYLRANFPGVDKYLMSSRERGVAFAVFNGKKSLSDKDLRKPCDGEIRIAPILTGSKNGGVFNVIVGAVIIIASVVYGVYTEDWADASQGIIAGAGMMVGGIVQMLTPMPHGLAAGDSADQTPNYAFNGAINTQAQGHCVPILYGEGIVGSAVISAGILSKDDIRTNVATGNGSMGGGIGGFGNPKDPYTPLKATV